MEDGRQAIYAPHLPSQRPPSHPPEGRKAKNRGDGTNKEGDNQRK